MSWRWCASIRARGAVEDTCTLFSLLGLDVVCSSFVVRACTLMVHGSLHMFNVSRVTDGGGGGGAIVVTVYGLTPPC